MSYKIDASDVNNLSNKIVPEKESRRRWLTYARACGFEKDLLLVFAKYDKLLKNCSNEKERDDIRKLGCVEVYRLLGGGGELYIDGQLVIKDN